MKFRLIDKLSYTRKYIYQIFRLLWEIDLNIENYRILNSLLKLKVNYLKIS